MDALGDHRQFEVAERHVEVERGQVQPRGVGVGADQHLPVGETGVGAHRVPGSGHVLGARVPVDQQQSQVGQRVAQGGQLPVDDRGDPVAVRLEDHVVQAVVAVDHAHPLRRRHRPFQAAHQLGHLGQLPGRRQRPLLGPPRHLAGGEPLGTAQALQHGGVRGVQGGQRLHQGQRTAPGRLGRQAGGVRGVAQHRAVHLLHHGEVGAEHGVVPAEHHGSGDRDGGAVQRADDPVLAGHVVGGGQHVADRRPPQHPARAAVGEAVGQVGAAPGDQGGPQRAGQPDGGLQVRRQPCQVQTDEPVGPRGGGFSGHGTPPSPRRSPRSWPCRSSGPRWRTARRTARAPTAARCPGRPPGRGRSPPWRPAAPWRAR